MLSIRGNYKAIQPSSDQLSPPPEDCTFWVIFGLTAKRLQGLGVVYGIALQAAKVWSRFRYCDAGYMYMNKVWSRFRFFRVGCQFGLLFFCSVDYQFFVSLLLLFVLFCRVCCQFWILLCGLLVLGLVWAASFGFCRVGCQFWVLPCGLPVLPCGLPVLGFAVWAANVGFSVGCQFWVLQCIGYQFGVLQCIRCQIGVLPCVPTDTSSSFFFVH